MTLNRLHRPLRPALFAALAGAALAAAAPGWAADAAAGAPTKARSTPAKPAAAKPPPARTTPAKAARPAAKPIQPRRRVRPAAGAASARPVAPPPTSDAATVAAYRKDAARHLYSMNLDSIYKGRMQPLLYAVGVLRLPIDAQGRVGSIQWMRAPNHAPEVMRAIERIIRAAEPFPPHALGGGMTYTETWLWDKSGKWQLHTLSEGQD